MQIQSSISLIECFDPQIFITHHNSLSATHSQIELITPTGLLPFLPDNSIRGHSLQSNQKPLPKEAPWEWGTKGDSIVLLRASHNHAPIKTDTLAPVKRRETVKVRQEFAPKVCNPQWSSMYVYIRKCTFPIACFLCIRTSRNDHNRIFCELSCLVGGRRQMKYT